MDSPTRSHQCWRFKGQGKLQILGSNAWTLHKVRNKNVFDILFYNGLYFISASRFHNTLKSFKTRNWLENSHSVCNHKVHGNCKCHKGDYHVNDLKSHFGILNFFQLLVKFPTCQRWVCKCSSLVLNLQFGTNEKNL